MAEGGQEIPEEQIESPVMEEGKSYTTSDEKEKVQSHPSVSQETKNFKEKVSAMEKIEQKLKDYAQALYINAHKEKQSTSTAVKENVSSVQSVRQEKGVVNEKLKTIQNKVVEMEQKLSDLAQALYIKAQGDLPKEVQPLLSGTRDMVTSQVLSERRNVLAMEFGQTYSSFAFSSDASGDPLVGMLFSRLLSNKTATAILLDEKDNFTFFGCEAEEQYARIVESDKKEKYHYFKSFPTVLRSCEKHGRNPSLKDEGGMSFDAQRVFALSIEYFVDMLLLELESGPLGISMDDVNFVITIPAVSGETASQFVIDAAKKAGIDNDQVITVLEPVAASVYCQRVDSYAKENECFRPAVGDMYLVVDLGGDSTKITVHTKAVEDGHDSVKSVTHGPCGGNSINGQFMKILEDALGTNVLALLKKKNAESYLNLFRQFEMAKRKFRSDSLKIEIPFPQVLDDICKNEYDRTVSEAFTDSEYGKWISVSGQKLIMEGEQFQQLFRPTLNEVKNFTKDVLSKDENKDIRSILMIGGFSRCDLVKKEIVDEFTSQRVFIPKDPDLAILKGAVFYGRLPYTLRGKIHQYTFGIQNWPKFDSKKHPNERKVMIGNNAHCKGSFSTFAQKGRRVEVGTICRKFFLALEPDADSLVCEIYASHKPYPEFTSECILQGTIEIKLPKLKPENLIIEESFYFGETEMFVEARDIYLTPYKVDCSYQMRIET